MRLQIACLAFALLAAPGARAGTVNISQTGQAFSESEITVKPGDHVNFENQDDVNHNILVVNGDDDDDAKDMGVQPPGGNVEVTFDKTGRFKIRCHIHPAMRMVVNVK